MWTDTRRLKLGWFRQHSPKNTYPFRYSTLRTTSCIDFHFPIAKDEWDTPYIFKAHEQGVNSISWAPLIGLKDYAVSGKLSMVVVIVCRNKSSLRRTSLCRDWPLAAVMDTLRFGSTIQRERRLLKLKATRHTLTGSATSPGARTSALLTMS